LIDIMRCYIDFLYYFHEGTMIEFVPRTFVITRVEFVSKLGMYLLDNPQAMPNIVNNGKSPHIRVDKHILPNGKLYF
jgi:hypothetical protein